MNTPRTHCWRSFRVDSPHPLASRARALACAAALFLAACGGGGDTQYVAVPVPVPAPTPEPVDALKPYREQIVQWEACDSTILGSDGDWTVYGERLRCANVRVPLDYENPSRGDASVAMMRMGAADPLRRRGALFFNPGGPGGDGLGLTFVLISAFADSDPAHPLGRLQLQLLDEYDMIGFSPRGTGASTRLLCATNELVRAVDYSPGARTPQAIENMLYNTRKTVQACEKNPLTPFINTEATAQDMDLMRGLLGDDRLNYLGYSYGTWLGAWYASRFPERVGRMVLDSNMDFTSDGDTAELMTAPAFQRVWDEVYAPYAARHPQAFNLGPTPEAVRAVPQGLSSAVWNLAIPELTQAMYRAVHTDTALTMLSGAHGLSQLMAHFPHADAEALSERIESHDFVPGDIERSAQAREAAESLLAELQAPEEAESVFLNGADATYMAVMCNDTPHITDIDYWIDIGDQYHQRYPLLGGQVTEQPCAYWSRPAVTKPPVSAMAGLDILMVQSQYDPATATEGALRAFAALPQAHLVYVPGEHTHGLYPYTDTCLDTAVTRFLLGQSPEQRETHCAAHSLALDTPATQARVRATAATTSAYRDPERAKARIEQFKQGIGRAGSALRH